MSDTDLDARLEQLESKLAFAEATVAELNDALVGQQRQIMSLEDKITRLNERMRSLQQGVASGAEGAVEQHEVPPHY